MQINRLRDAVILELERDAPLRQLVTYCRIARRQGACVGRSGRPDNPQVLTPRSNGLRILTTHNAGDLDQVIQVVRHPRGEMLAEGHSPKLGMLTRPFKIGGCQPQRPQPAKAVSAQFLECVQQLSKGPGP